MEATYPTLVGEIATRGIKKSAIARACNLSERGFYNKLSGISPFTWPETKIIQSTFFPDIGIEELFAKDEE